MKQLLLLEGILWCSVQMIGINEEGYKSKLSLLWIKEKWVQRLHKNIISAESNNKYNSLIVSMHTEEVINSQLSS